MTAQRDIPRPVSAAERWIAKHAVCGLRVHHVQTGVDTSETEVELIPSSGKPVRWKADTFREVARLELSWATCVEPKYGVREAVEAREKWEAAEARDLAELRRLKAKFGETR